MAYGRTPGILGEHLIRKLIKQHSESITPNMPPVERRRILAEIMSLRQELQTGAKINKKHYEKRQANEGEFAASQEKARQAAQRARDAKKAKAVAEEPQAKEPASEPEEE